MAKKVREENIPLINYVDEVKDGDVSDNQDVQRYFCSDKSFINGIGVTILTGDYLPPLILAEVPLNEDIVQKYIVDGLQRTTALIQIRYGNHKFSGTIEDNQIEYQEKKMDESGVFVKDEEGNFIWEKKFFNIKNKTYDDFPKELKKRFDTYQLRIATYQNCTMEKVSKLVRKLNQHKSMNVSQQSITWIPTYAKKIKTIAETSFFKNSINYNDNYRKNGEYLQAVCRSVMNVFHFNNYKKEAKKISNYLEEHSSIKEFDIIQNYFDRIERVCKDSAKNIFIKKDIPIWVAVFDNFTMYELPDDRFADFIIALNKNLHNKMINGTSYDLLNEARGTTDKVIVAKKIDTYTNLMLEFLHIDKENDNNYNNSFVFKFIRNNIDPDITLEDLDVCYDTLEYCKNKLHGFNDKSEITKCKYKISLIAIIVFAIKNEIDLDEWLVFYSNNNNTYFDDILDNYNYMLKSLNDFKNKKCA